MTPRRSGTILPLGRACEPVVFALNKCAAVDLQRATAFAKNVHTLPRSRRDRVPSYGSLYAVDGGAAVCAQLGLRPDRVAGDMDSLPAAARRQLMLQNNVVVFPRSKSFSDFRGALEDQCAAVAGIRRSASLGVVAGLLGGELEHEWANVLEAADFLGSNADGPLNTLVAFSAERQRAIVVTTKGCRMLDYAKGAKLSVFTPLLGRAPAPVVSLTGARWSLHRHTLERPSHGLHNEVRLPRVTLNVHSGVAILVAPLPKAVPSPPPAKKAAKKAKKPSAEKPKADKKVAKK